MTDAARPFTTQLVHELVARQAARTPTAAAVIDGQRTVSYAELDRHANQLARVLRQAGAGAEVPVGVCLHRGVNLVTALLAVWKAGAAYLPLDPGHPPQRAQRALRDAGAALLVTEQSLAGLAETGQVSPVVLDPELTVLKGRSRSAPAAGLSGDNAAYVLYTSGSTGRPKGVLVSHAGIANRLGSMVATHRLSAADRVLQKTALTFDAAALEIFAPLISGGTVVLAPAGAESDAAAIVQAVITHGITVLQVVPSVLRMLVEEPGLGGCTSLRLLLSAGEPLHAELVQRFLGELGAGPAPVEVWNTYGPTECSIDVAACRFDPAQHSGPVPIGRPIGGMRVLVADANGRPAAAGARGELYAGGIGVARGYLGRPDLTAAQFVPDPYGPDGSRLYRTGDLARWSADGNLCYLGRIDDQVKINGVRIEPAEVEAALLAHPEVRAAAVTSFVPPAGSARLVAYLQCPAGQVPAGLRDFLSGHLPATHIPSVFVELEHFPATSSGKLDRSALPAPDLVGDAGPDPDTAPRTAAELLVAGLWRELLQIGDIGTGDDFFRLGGSSLQFTRLANRLRAATGKQIELPRLLSATTVAAQALLVQADGGQAPPVRPVARDRALPLSFGQRRLWVLDQMRPGDREWISGVFIRLPGDVSIEIVQQALDVLVERHEGLRTRFAVSAGEPVQIVGPSSPMALRTVGIAEGGLPAVLERELDIGFDLERGPAVRALLAREAAAGPAAQQVLVLLMHHIICDGWSAAILEREFGEILTAMRAGVRPALPPLEVQYADYALWQREQLTAEVAERELRHWRTVLDGSAPLALRTDRTRPAARDARGGAVRFTVPAPLTRALTDLGRRHDATPFMTLMTAFATLLARYTDRWDVTIGTPVAGRDRPEIEGVVGFFLNSLVIRCPLAGGMGLRQALEEVRDTCRAAFAHQGLPFERLVEELAPSDRDLSRTPLYQVAFDLHDERLTGSASNLADLGTLTEVWQVAKTDLTLYLRRQPDGTMIGGFEYATALFARPTIERMAGHFLRLLESVAADPQGRLDALDFIPADELVSMSEWDFGPGPEVSASALQMFEERAAADPGAVAVLAAGAEVSFAELDERADQFARQLRGLGVGPESVVGVLLDRGADLLACLIGIWKAGGAYAPLDPAFPADRIGFVLDDCGARVVVTQSAYTERLAEHFAGRLVLTDLPAEQTGTEQTAAEQTAAERALVPGRPGELDLLAYVIYTSGSTGRPKGVQVTHRGLANHLGWAARELAACGTGGAPVFSSIAFDLVVPNLWAPLLAGQPVHMLPQDLDLAYLGRSLAAAGPFSFIKLTPGHLEILSQQLPPGQAAGLAGTIVVAGEALPVPLADRWATAMGAGRLINEYGPTEASVGACTFPVPASLDAETVPIGRPLPGVIMRVLDDRLRRVPVGVPGELYVGGAGLARGYANRPDLTAGRFGPDPYGLPGSRIYRTGDVVRLLPGGNVDFIGRLDGQVKIRGYRVEPGEIEVVLAEHPAVREAVVILTATEAGTGRLAAYCVPEPTASSPADDLLAALAAHCAARLPDYMIPGTCVLIDSIPLTANGKLDRAALARLDEAPAGETQEPRGIVQERIAAIFAELLGTAIGASSDFFQAGGNSILAIRLIAAIQSAFEVDLPIRAVFEGPTVARLAERVEEIVRAEIESMPEADLFAQAQRFDGELVAGRAGDGI